MRAQNGLPIVGGDEMYLRMRKEAKPGETDRTGRPRRSPNPKRVNDGRHQTSPPHVAHVARRRSRIVLAPRPRPRSSSRSPCLSPPTTPRPIHDGLFTDERGRAGPHVPRYRKETGQLPRAPYVHRAMLNHALSRADAGLSAHVLQPRREVFQLVLQRLYLQGPVLQGGAPVLRSHRGTPA